MYKSCLVPEAPVQRYPTMRVLVLGTRILMACGGRQSDQVQTDAANMWINDLNMTDIEIFIEDVVG